MSLSIEISSPRQIFAQTSVRRFCAHAIIIAAIIIADYFVFYSEHWLILFISFILYILGSSENQTDIGSFLSSIFQKNKNKQLDGNAKGSSGFIEMIFVTISVLVIVFALRTPWIFWGDTISFSQKAHLHLEYFSTYSTIEGVRLKNDCWAKILNKDHDSSMLIDEDGDGQSQYCETYDDNFLITPTPTINQFVVKSLEGKRYVIGSPFVWENIQTKDPSEAIEGYEVIFTARDNLSSTIMENLEPCNGMFNRMKRTFVCYPTGTTIQWLGSHALDALTMTVRSFDFVGRRRVLLPSFPIILST